MSLLKAYQDGVTAYLRGDFHQAIRYHQTLLKQYVFYYANTSSVDTLSYALDSVLVLHSKVWLQLEQSASTHRFQRYKQQKFIKTQGLLAGADVLLVYIKNRIGFTKSPAVRQGFKSLETIQKVLKRKINRNSLM